MGNKSDFRVSKLCSPVCSFRAFGEKRLVSLEAFPRTARGLGSWKRKKRVKCQKHISDFCLEPIPWNGRYVTRPSRNDSFGCLNNRALLHTRKGEDFFCFPANYGFATAIPHSWTSITFLGRYVKYYLCLWHLKCVKTSNSILIFCLCPSYEKKKCLLATFPDILHPEKMQQSHASFLIAPNHK